MNPILLEIPMPIVTERLLIRNPLPGDGPSLNAAVCESIDVLRERMPWADHKPTASESEENVRRAYAAWITREDLRLLIFDRTTGEFIGGSGLHRADWTARRFEIGYWCKKSKQGHGYITEAVSAITRYAFATLDARRIEIRCDADNVKSKGIAERLGFTLEARLCKESTKIGTGELRDTLVYVRFDAVGIC